MSAARRNSRTGRRARTLGQNFLVDRNILGVIERLAEVSEDDVVLEIGGGEGMLSRHLAPRVRHLHVIEVDARLEAGLRALLAEFPGTSLHMGDAVTLELADLEPPPTKLVANLPYGVAATVILRTIEELGRLTRWVAMVQREVGERLAASPSSAAYGAPSVLAQLSCDVRVLRSIPRTVFRPVPNVDSVLVGLWRRRPVAERGVRDLVHAAFAHRRKALARSIVLARGDPALREPVREALVALGHPPDARAERLAPQDFLDLAHRLGETWPPR